MKNNTFIPSQMSVFFQNLYFPFSDGLANAAGVVTGEHSNMTGNAFLNLDGSGSSGNANMDAQGGGKGPSSALTSGALELTDGDNVKRSASRFICNSVEWRAMECSSSPAEYQYRVIIMVPCGPRRTRIDPINP